MECDMSQDRSQPIRLLLVDDHEVVRIGLQTLFSRSEHIRIVGEAGSMAAAITVAQDLKPDVVLMDIRLPDGSGVEACREIRAASPTTRVLFLTSYESDDVMFEAIFAGADGYLLKEVGGTSLIKAIEMVAAGQSVLDPAATERIVARMKTGSTKDIDEKGRSLGLSPQERRVLALVSEGKTNKEIAAALGLSDKTVKNYLSNVYQKMHVTRRSQAAVVFSRLASQ
jgi:two-component system response regulator DevR